MRLRSVWNQNRNSAGRYWHKHNIFDMNLKKSKREPAIIWKRITSKKYSTLMSRHLSPRYGQVILVSGYPVLTADNIDVQSAFSWAPKVSRKCESKHWYAVVRTDGWSVGRSITWLPNFLGWVDLFTHGALLARFARGAPLIKDSINRWILQVKTIFSWSPRKNVCQDNVLEFVLPAVVWRF